MDQKLEFIEPPYDLTKDIQVRISRLYELKAARDSLASYINEQMEIAGLNGDVEDLKKLDGDLKSGLAELGQLVPPEKWTDSKFLKSQKKKGKVYRVGEKGGLIKHSKEIRKVIVGKFVAAYPLVAAKIGKIMVGDAEKEIGKNELENFVEKEEQNTYELIN